MLENIRVQSRSWQIVLFIVAALIVWLLPTYFRPQTFHKVLANSLPAKLLWSYESPKQISVPPRSNKQLVVILQEDGIFLALDSRTGGKVWEYDTKSRVLPPWSENLYDLNDEILVTAVNHEELIVVDVQTGQETWRIKLNPTPKTTPSVLLINDVVIVSTFSVNPTTEGYIAGYHLKSQTMIWEEYFPSRAYESTFMCPDFLRSPGSNSYTVCVSLYNQLNVIDFNPHLSSNSPRNTRGFAWSLASYDPPLNQNTVILFNPSPKSAIQVVDIQSGERYSLPHNCSNEQVPYPAQLFEELVLATTGCGEFYVFDNALLSNSPNWISQSPYDLRSSFLTLDGEVGFVLDEKAEILAVDLETGGIVGQFTTKPASLEKARELNSLGGEMPYLYAFFNGNQLFAFEIQ